MKFFLADSFQAALAKLTNAEQKAVKLTVFDLQQDPSHPSLQFHRIEKSWDSGFWSVRVNGDIRLILHRTKDSILVAYVDHHDDAYQWARKRRIEAHPTTGAAQIVAIREEIQDLPLPANSQADGYGAAYGLQSEDRDPFRMGLFVNLTRDDLRKVGVPEDWLRDVHHASEENFFTLYDYIPGEAAEALLHYAATGQLLLPEERPEGLDPFLHPDAARRFRVMENLEALQNALDYPWDKWAVFLHPDQEALVSADYNGPVRISGSAGTGKTVVALHRVAHLLKSDPSTQILLTTFSSPLTNALAYKLKLLLPQTREWSDRIQVMSFDQVAQDLFQLIEGYTPKIAKPAHMEEAISQAVEELGLEEMGDPFFQSEWRHVVDAWQIADEEAYADVPRLGRKNRLGRKQRARIWPVFERARAILKASYRMSLSDIYGRVADYYRDNPHKPYRHIIVDEAQDLSVPALKMIAALKDDDKNGIFLAGDLGQRIFQEPFSWRSLGVDIRGRSHILRVNYRTSHQIREMADRLLPLESQDVDGIAQKRTGTISVFNGPKPEVIRILDEEEEASQLGLKLHEWLDEGIPATEIGLFVRDRGQLHRARAVANEAGVKALELSDRFEERKDTVAIGTMHLAKGLEFKAVLVMACDEDIMPSMTRIEQVADEAALEEVYDTERHLFYVACTRARDHLVISALHPGSEFLDDLLG